MQYYQLQCKTNLINGYWRRWWVVRYLMNQPCDIFIFSLSQEAGINYKLGCLKIRYSQGTDWVRWFVNLICTLIQNKLVFWHLLSEPNIIAQRSQSISSAPSWNGNCICRISNNSLVVRSRTLSLYISIACQREYINSKYVYYFICSLFIGFSFVRSFVHIRYCYADVFWLWSNNKF